VIKRKTNQLIKLNPNLAKLYRDLEMIDCPIKLTYAISQGSKVSLIVLATYFHGVVQLNYKK